MGAMGKISFFVLVLVASAAAQSHLQTTAPAGSGPSFNVSFGYSYITVATPDAGRVNLNGLDAGGHIDFSQHWGAMVDAGYARAWNVLGTGQNGYVLSFLGGPVFYPIEHRNNRVFLHALIGASLVGGAVPVSGTNYLHGWVARPSYALGGGFEQSLFGPFAVRIGGDYLRTSYVNSDAVVQPENDLRVTASVMFRLNARRY
jgi:hypothetical protein